MGGLGGEFVETQRIDFLRANVGDASFVLKFSRDAKSGRLRDQEPLTFEAVRVHDGVGDAGFVFERDEDDAFGQTRRFVWRLGRRRLGFSTPWL